MTTLMSAPLGVLVHRSWTPPILRVLAVAAVAALVVTAGRPRIGHAQTQPGSDATVDSLLQTMTLDEKLSLLHGANDTTETAGAGYVPGMPRLNIPPLRLADGPAGIRTSRPATALPAPVALASSFSPTLARRFGEVIGQEGRARNQEVLLSPMVNIVRVPQAGRNFETFGEDPDLASKMVAGEIRGIQGEGLIATVKHYAVNNFEQDRQQISAEVDERSLREMYLPGFEAAVAANVGAIMCAYNRVNGTYACENSHLLQDVLREEFGFDGWVMTDWWAGHSLTAIENGLDQEMPGINVPGIPQPVYFADSLKAAVEAEEISEETVDQSVRRILSQLERFDLIGESSTSTTINEENGAKVAREVATAGAVLLRNQSRDGAKTLPLTENDQSSVVVVGPTAKHPLYGGGGSSRVRPFSLDSPIEVLQTRIGNGGSIQYEPGIDHDGVPVPASALAPAADSDEDGLRRGAEADGAVDSTVDFVGADAIEDAELQEGSITWTGTLTAPSTGTYDLKLQTKGGGGQLSLDGEQFLSTAGFFNDASLILTDDGLNSASGKVELTAGESKTIEITVEREQGSFMNPSSDAPMQVRFAWVSPDRRTAFRQRAARAAREAQGAVVFAYNEGTESVDRSSLGLPKTQDALIQQVAAANPRTTVVLNTGDPTTMPWLSETGAVLQMWYPGQEGAEATADLLTGDANPGGKLPVTFPKDEADAPTHPTDRYPGTDGSATYSEGVFVGYRWYDAEEIAPLFPFGHGLSYTSFAYSDLNVTVDEDHHYARFRVRNTGDRSGTEVAQVYLGAPDNPPVEMAPRQLVGFERVELDPGEETTVRVRIDRRDRSYWSTEESKWVPATGSRPVRVGSSSRDLRLQGHLSSK